MRFERLSVPAFGPFTEFVLEFPRGASDFHLIYGPNEAGKSSLLRAIRDLLYGIHGQTPDNFLHPYKELRIAGTIVNSAGQPLSFQRRKGNKNTLLDDTGNLLRDDTLTAFLGVVDRDFFTTIFGLGSEDLRQGAEALLHGQGELGQALFSASLAGTPVHRILHALEADARTLFDGRARTNVSIRPAVDDYEGWGRQSKAAIVRPEVWEETLNAVVEAMGVRDKIDEELQQHRTRRDWLQRCLDALPTLGQLGDQEEKLAALPVTPDLGADFVVNAEQVIAGRDRSQESLIQLRLGIEQLEARVRENQPKAKVLGHAGEIESVHSQLAVYRQWKSERVSLDTDLDRAASELQAGMRRLGLVGKPAIVESLRVPAANELTLREAARGLDAATARMQANSEAAVRIEKELDKVTTQLAALPVTDVSALRLVLVQTIGAMEAAKTLSRKKARLKGLLRKVEIQHGLLRSAPAGHRATFNLPVPAAATLRQFEAELMRIDGARARLEEGIAAADVKLERLTWQLTRLERRGTLPTVAALQEARTHRDQGWEKVLAVWKGGQEEGELDGRPLVEAYPLTVAQADVIADQLRRDAEIVTQAEELRLQLREVKAEKAKVQGELEQLDLSRADWKARWNTAWSPYGIPLGSPSEMLEWRDGWMEFRTGYEAWENAYEELAAAEAEIEAAVTLLGPLVSAGEDQSLVALRDEAERQVQVADEAKGARAQLRQQEATHQSDLKKLETERPGLRASEKQARTAWGAKCRDLSLPIEASTETGLALVDQRKQLVDKFDVWISLQQGIGGKRRAIGTYETGVHALADGLKITAGAVEVREHALWTMLGEARAHEARQIQAQTDLEQEEARRPRVQQNLVKAEQAVADCVALAGTSGEADLKIMLVSLKARRAIEEEIERLRQTLHVSSRGEPLDAFIERVRAEPGDALAAERDGLDQAIPTIEAQRDQAVQNLAKAEDEKRKLEQSGAEAAEYLQIARSIAVRIRHDASRYLRLQLAIRFLHAQIERFRNQNQAPMLTRAGELFRAITETSFEELRAGFTEDDTPVLVGVRNGNEVGVRAMSDGTRDQLYLALRLAAIERHQEHHEPMPVILDDLLVNFDDQRAQAILPLLCDLGRKTQVMLFTHHRHLVELAQDALTEEVLHICALQP